MKWAKICGCSNCDECEPVFGDYEGIDGYYCRKFSRELYGDIDNEIPDFCDLADVLDNNQFRPKGEDNVIKLLPIVTCNECKLRKQTMEGSYCMQTGEIFSKIDIIPIPKNCPLRSADEILELETVAMFNKVTNGDSKV